MSIRLGLACPVANIAHHYCKSELFCDALDHHGSASHRVRSQLFPCLCLQFFNSLLFKSFSLFNLLFSQLFGRFRIFLVFFKLRIFRRTSKYLLIDNLACFNQRSALSKRRKWVHFLQEFLYIRNWWSTCSQYRSSLKLWPHQFSNLLWLISNKVCDDIKLSLELSVKQSLV